MIVVRTEIKTKQGHLDEAIALYKAEAERIFPGVPARVYRIESGVLDRFAVEWEAESLADVDRISADWMARVSDKFYAKYVQVTRSGSKVEYWSLV